MVLTQKVSRLLEAEEDLSEIDQWRERILAKILVIILVLGSATAIPAVYLAFQRGPELVTFVDAVALGWIAMITLRPKLSFRFRAYSLVALNYVVGVWFLLSVGVVSQIYLLAVPIFAALFLGLGPAIAALGLNAATLIVIGYLVRGNLSIPGLESQLLLKWVIISMNFTFIDAVLTLSCAMLLQRLQAAFKSHKKTMENLEANSVQLASANGELAVEIAVRKQAEEETNRLARAVEQASETILMSDAEGRIVYANHAFEILSGKSRTSMPVLWLHQLKPVGADSEPVASIIQEQRQWSGLVEFLGSDGTTREMQTVISPSRDSGGRVTNFVAVMRDVTRERQFEARLRQSEKLEAIGTLAGGIAHDFNNIIGSILGIAELTQMELRNTPLESGIETIVVACNRARDIVRQMMVFSKQNSLTRTPVSLRKTLEENLPLLRAAIPSNIEIRHDVTCDAVVNASPAEIQQILMNLGANAFNAMSHKDSGTLTISIKTMQMDEALARIYPRLQSGVRYVCLEVSDDGHGIDAKDLSNIFDPFFTTRGATGGTGLGLASVHAIVTSLGGEITVITQVGMGTTFRIYLAEVEPVLNGNGAEVSQLARGEGRVLLVDDESALLNIATRILEERGYSPTTADSGEAALAMFTADPFYFDLVITDLTMSGISGADLIRQLKKMRPDLPTILTSGFADVGAYDGEELLNAATYLPKPYTRQELLTKVSSLLSDR